MDNRRIHAVACVLAVGGTGCTQIPAWFGDGGAIPTNIAWVGVYVDGGAGTTGMGSGLVPRYQDAFRLFAQTPEASSRVFVLGFTTQRLADIGAPDDEPTLRSRPLTEAQSGDPVLPRPDWIGRGSVAMDQIHVEASPDAPPPLTVSWLPPCPKVLTSSQAYVDFPCLTTPCSGRAQQRACDFVVDLPGCKETLHARIDGAGQLTYDNSTTLGMCGSIAPGEGAVGAFSCMGSGIPACTGEIYPPEAPRMRADVVTVSPNPYPSPDVLSNFSLDETGYIVGPAILKDRVGAVVFDRFVHRGDCDTWRFVFIDPETLEVTKSATRASCLVALTAAGDGFLAVEWQPSTIRRFDRKGTPGDVVALPAGVGPEELVVSASGRGAALFQGDPSRRVASILWTFDLDPLELLAPVMLAPGARVAGYLADDTLVVVDRPGDVGAPVVELVDPGGTVNHVPGQNCPTGGIIYASMSRTGTVVVMSARGSSRILHDRSSFIWKEGPPVTCGDSVFFESGAVGFASHVWPADPRLFIVGVDTVGIEATGALDNGPTRLALLDIHRGAFRPGSVPVGRGPIHKMVADDKGRIWASLPWEGRILRISPAP